MRICRAILKKQGRWDKGHVALTGCMVWVSQVGLGLKTKMKVYLLKSKFGVKVWGLEGVRYLIPSDLWASLY